eukprot:gene3018-3921_t
MFTPPLDLAALGGTAACAAQKSASKVSIVSNDDVCTLPGVAASPRSQEERGRGGEFAARGEPLGGPTREGCVVRCPAEDCGALNDVPSRGEAADRVRRRAEETEERTCLTRRDALLIDMLAQQVRREVQSDRMFEQLSRLAAAAEQPHALHADAAAASPPQSARTAAKRRSAASTLSPLPSRRHSAASRHLEPAGCLARVPSVSAAQPRSFRSAYARGGWFVSAAPGAEQPPSPRASPRTSPSSAE